MSLTPVRPPAGVLGARGQGVPGRVGGHDHQPAAQDGGDGRPPAARARHAAKEVSLCGVIYSSHHVYSDYLSFHVTPCLFLFISLKITLIRTLVQQRSARASYMLRLRMNCLLSTFCLA